MIKTLVSLTETILQEVTTAKLFEKGLLPEAKQLQIELLLARRRIELAELDSSKLNERKSYIKSLKKWINDEKAFLRELSVLTNDSSQAQLFINDLIDGMKQLQSNDTNAPCIMNVRNNQPNRETSFRYWFKDFFAARYPSSTITAEEEKGKGRIDLKIIHASLGTKIIEFKGWWNQSKDITVQQICSYLTDFEKEGYIFIINHSKSKDITSLYKEMIVQPQVNYIEDSWKEIKIENSDLSYFQSMHKFFIKEKVIYHFFFNAYF